MNGRIKRIQKLQDILGNIIDEMKKIYTITKDIDNKSMKKQLIEFILAYSRINAEFCIYLMNKIPESYRKDVIDRDFEKIIKPLKDQYKNKGKNGTKR